MRRRGIGWMLALGLLALTASRARADTFILKDGSRYEGVAEKDGDSLIIKTFDGKVVRVKESDVMGVKKDEARNEYFQRKQKLKGDDAASHYELGLWAQGKKELAEEAREQFLQVLKADPFHEGAGKALGYVQKDGRWVSPGGAPDEPFVVGPAKPPVRPAAGNALDEARKLAKDLEKLNIPGGTDWEKNGDVRAMAEQAKEHPEVLAHVLKAPGWKESANVQDAAIRAKAAVVLGITGDRRAMQPLLDACFEDPDDRVRWAAAKALPKLEEPIALRKLVDVAIGGDKNWPTRKLACIALRRYADKEAVERLMAELSFELAGGNFKDPKNAPRAANTGPGTDNPLGVPLNNMPTQAEDATIIYPVLSAIKEVTGQSFDSGDKEMRYWRDWWKKAEPTFQFKD
ncbi:MAG: HEAT repeat domain-containing protein [Planctomycetes bacterium]|nr:HEAT repeat domain-containing protein [Planctomycetota bacterium]